MNSVGAVVLLVFAMAIFLPFVVVAVAVYGALVSVERYLVHIFLQGN